MIVNYSEKNFSEQRIINRSVPCRGSMEVIEVDHLKDINNKRLSWAMPHSGLKPKNENDPKEEDDFQWNTTFDGKRLLTDDDIWQKTTFNRRQPLTEDELWRKMTPDGRTTFDARRLLTEDGLR